jgi:hypothetical protein
MPAEHEHEALPGLPAALPHGERILWQGRPQLRTVALRVFHLRKFAVYFAVLLAWRAITALADGASLPDALVHTLWLLPVALAGLGLIALVAWLTVTTTIYTITNRRVVLRIGIALTITVNVPFKIIESAGLKVWSNGSGDIPLKMNTPDKMAWLHLWPHCRPWRYSTPEPMMLGVPNAQKVAGILAQALADAFDAAPLPTPEPRAAARRDDPQGADARLLTETERGAPVAAI